MRLLAPEGSARQRLLDAFLRRRVDANRIEFLSRCSRVEYMGYFREIDVCLDTFPYNGHTTSLDAWWMCVPTVSLMGQSCVSRAGYCYAMNLGLPELAASSPEAYVQAAIQLWSNPARLAEMRRDLRTRFESSPLMDAPRFTKHLERAYRIIWQRWCQGLPAARIEVERIRREAFTY
jgi:predicted O-linked N-acetylglucosamine transferase (SPINDLY family)